MTHNYLQVTPKKRSTNIINWFLLITALLLLFFGLEFFVRKEFKDEIDIDLLRKQNENTKINLITRPSNNKNLLYSLKPNLDVIWKNVRVATSEDGSYRIKPGSSKIKNPELKIAIIGDSSSFGWRVEYEQSYGEILRQRLSKFADKTIELRNFSVPGYNSLQHYTVFRDLVVPWAPDIAILHYDHNDVDPIGVKPPTYIPPEYGDNFINSSLIKFTLRRIRVLNNKSIMRKLTLENATNDQEKKYLTYIYSGPQYNKHLGYLEKLSLLAQNKDIPVVCYIFNTFIKKQSNANEDQMYTLLHKPLNLFLKKNKYIVVDSYPYIQKLLQEKNWPDLRKTWMSDKDAHPTPYGHQIISDILYDEIMQSNRLRTLIQR